MFDSFSINHVDKSDRGSTQETIVFLLVISFVPLVLGAIAQWMNSGPYKAVTDTFLNGQLYFYAMSFCASIFTTAHTATMGRNSRMRSWSSLFVICCGCFMAFYLGFAPDPKDPKIYVHGALSVFFLVAAVWILYRVSVLSEYPPPPPEEVNRAQAQIIADTLGPIA